MASLTNQELVRKFIQDERHIQKLLYSYELDSFFFYQEDKGYFKLQDRQLKEFENYVENFLYEESPKNITTARIEDIVKYLKIKTSRKVGSEEAEYLSFAEGQVLRLSDFTLHAYDLNKIALHHLPFNPYKVITMQPTPMWSKFLDEVVVKDNLTPDRELQSLLQEMFGYSLLQTTKAEKTFFLVGEGANGKSVMLNILRKVVGESNCSSKSIEALTTDRFATSGLIGKTVNICSEEESDYIKSDKFKAIVSGEPIDIERKFGEAVSGRFSVKFIFATNEMPTFSGFNNGLLRRMVIVPFKKTIEESLRDVDLSKKLEAELEGIVSWAIEGARRLVERKYRFILPEACKLKEEEFKENLSSSISFIKENYIIDETCFISNLDLYGSYKIWAKDRGIKAVKLQRFSKDITKLYGDSVVFWDKTNDKTIRGRPFKSLFTSLPLSSASDWPTEKYEEPKF